MRIIQILHTLSYGDAVSNDALALMDELLRLGYKTAIYAINIDKRITLKRVHRIEDIPVLHDNDIIFYHLSIGSELNYKIPFMTGRKILVYHNVTPYHFPYPYNRQNAKLCKEGIDGAKYLSDKIDYCLAVSDFNKQDLIGMGYRCKIDVLPILIPFSDYEKKPNQQLLTRYQQDGYTNILFTGRIAPNKKQEDVIAAFYEYQKYYNSKSRLILVGSYDGMELYYYKLKAYVKRLGVQNVIFTGHIPFDEILAYYHLADLFLCMSEHEGFCVPLVEAMFFRIPIVAYDSTAIGGTLGGSGVLLKKKNPLETAAVMDRVLTQTEWKNVILQKQQERLQDFAHNNIKQLFDHYLEAFIDKKKDSTEL